MCEWQIVANKDQLVINRHLNKNIKIKLKVKLNYVKITNGETFWAQGNVVNRYITFRGIPSGRFELQLVPTDAYRIDKI